MAQIPRVVCGELSWVWGNGGIVRMQTLDEKKKKKRKRKRKRKRKKKRKIKKKKRKRTKKKKKRKRTKKKRKRKKKKRKKTKRVDETLWDTEWIWICAVCCLGCSSDLVSFTWVTTHPCMFLNWSRDQFDTRPWSAIRRHNVAHGMIETD